VNQAVISRIADAILSPRATSRKDRARSGMTIPGGLERDLTGKAAGHDGPLPHGCHKEGVYNRMRMIVGEHYPLTG
jgi:hypothetical protein